MKGILKKLSVLGLALAISFSAFGVMPTQVSEMAEVQAASLKLSDKNVYLATGFNKTLSLGKVSAKKCVWKSSNKKVATVNKKGVVNTKKKGKAVISCTYKKKTYKCTINVVDAINLSDFDYDTTKVSDGETNGIDDFDKHAVSLKVTEWWLYGEYIQSNMRGLSAGDSYKDFQKKYGVEDYNVSKNSNAEAFMNLTNFDPTSVTFINDTSYVCECYSVITYNGTDYVAEKFFYFDSNDKLLGSTNRVAFNN